MDEGCSEEVLSAIERARWGRKHAVFSVSVAKRIQLSIQLNGVTLTAMVNLR